MKANNPHVSAPPWPNRDDSEFGRQAVRFKTAVSSM